MVYEVITSDFRFKCGNCKYFKSKNHIDGTCTCKENKIKYRERSYNSKSCSCKEVKHEKS